MNIIIEEKSMINAMCASAKRKIVKVITAV